MIEDFYPLIAAILASFIAQFLKPFTNYVKTKKFDIDEIFASGGFPSSHTATTTALALAFGLKSGFASNEFMISFVLMFIVSYDAMNVRLYAGKHISLTKQLISDLRKINSVTLDAPIYLTKMKDILGHERFEVFGGFILGIIVSGVLYIV